MSNCVASCSIVVTARSAVLYEAYLPCRQIASENQYAGCRGSQPGRIGLPESPENSFCYCGGRSLAQPLKKNGGAWRVSRANPAFISEGIFHRPALIRERFTTCQGFAE